MPTGEYINRLIDGRVGVKEYSGNYSAQDLDNSLMHYNRWIDDTKKLTTFSGKVLDFNYAKREESYEYKGLASSLTDGKLSVASTACKGCIKINACLPSDKGPLVCMVQAQPASDYQKDHVCIMCALRKRRDCDIQDESHEEDHNGSSDGDLSSAPDEDIPLSKSSKRSKRPSFEQGERARRACDESALVRVDGDDLRPDQSRRGRPSSINSFSRSAKKPRIRKKEAKPKKEEGADIAASQRASAVVFRNYTKLQKEHTKLESLQSRTEQERDQSRKDYATLAVDYNKLLEEKSQLQKRLADEQSAKENQRQQQQKESTHTPSTVATTHSVLSPVTLNSATAQLTQGDRLVSGITINNRHIEDIMQEFKVSEAKTRELKARFDPQRLDEYESSRAKMEKFQRDHGPEIKQYYVSKAKTERLRREAKSAGDKCNQMMAIL